MKSNVAFTIEPQHLALLRQFAKDQGYPSTSSALRRIIDEWSIMRRANHALAHDADCDEAARATVEPVGILHPVTNISEPTITFRSSASVPNDYLYDPTAAECGQ